MKLILDYKHIDALDIINFIVNYKEKRNVDLDILAFDIDGKNEISRAYFALYYCKKYGVELEYSKRILEAYHNENKDINRVDVLAQCYKEIGYDENDMIDSLMDGDYNDMYNFIQDMYLRKEGIENNCSLIVYGEENNKKVISGCDNVKEWLNELK